MTIDSRGGHLCTTHFPLLAAALERHMCWALDHATLGEDDIAASLLLDVRAIASEITEQDDDLAHVVGL
jgi:hypothetical protein